MENLSLSNLLDHETLAFFDESTNEETNGQARHAVSTSGYSTVGLFDSLSAYAAVFDCSGTCRHGAGARRP